MSFGNISPLILDPLVSLLKRPLLQLCCIGALLRKERELPGAPGRLGGVPFVFGQRRGRCCGAFLARLVPIGAGKHEESDNHDPAHSADEKSRFGRPGAGEQAFTAGWRFFSAPFVLPAAITVFLLPQRPLSITPLHAIDISAVHRLAVAPVALKVIEAFARERG